MEPPIWAVQEFSDYNRKSVNNIKSLFFSMTLGFLNLLGYNSLILLNFSYNEFIYYDRSLCCQITYKISKCRCKQSFQVFQHQLSNITFLTPFNKIVCKKLF